MSLRLAEDYDTRSSKLDIRVRANQKGQAYLLLNRSEDEVYSVKSREADQMSFERDSREGLFSKFEGKSVAYVGGSLVALAGSKRELLELIRERYGEWTKISFFSIPKKR